MPFTLAPADRVAIHARPIATGLDAFRHLFSSRADRLLPSTVDRTSASFFHNLSAHGQDYNELLLEAIQALQVLAAPRSLPPCSRSAVGSLWTDLIAFSAHLVSGSPPPLSHSSKLLRLVVCAAPDVDVWTSVYDCLLSPSTVDSQPSTAQTPIKRNSSSHMSLSTSHALLDEYLREELDQSLFPSTEGFFEHFFAGKSWSNAVNLVFERSLDRYSHAHSRWLDWPPEPKQSLVLAWYSTFIQDLVRDTDRRYYASPDKPLSSSRSARKCDLFLHRKLDSMPGKPRYSWSRVLVVGELKLQSAQSSTPDIMIQLAGYVREVFATQPGRRFVHAFTLCGDMMRCWIFHRAGGFGSVEFNINTNPRRFITVMVGYASMSNQELGFDPTISVHQESGGWSIAIPGPDGNPRELELLSPPFFSVSAIASRGTICWMARERKIITSDAGDPGEWKYVVKDSWRSEERMAEGTMMLMALEKNVWGIAEYYAHEDVMVNGIVDDIHGNIAKGLKMGIPLTLRHRRSSTFKRSVPTPSWNFNITTTTSNSAEAASSSKTDNSNSRKRSNDSSYTSSSPKFSRLRSADLPNLNRIHSRIVTTHGIPIYKFETLTQLITAFQDTIKAHHCLFKNKILHRDISINNLMITSPYHPRGDGARGFLIDLDLAIPISPTTSTTTPSAVPHRTGTMEFMAIGALLNHKHTYRHDLESFLYVLLWISITYRRTHHHKILQDWRAQSYDVAAIHKRGLMDKECFNLLLDAFAESMVPLKDLAMGLRNVLFPIRDGCLWVGTDEDADMVYSRLLEVVDREVIVVESLERENASSEGIAIM